MILLNIVLWVGIVFALLGVVVLGIIIYKTRSIHELSEGEQREFLSQMIVWNFGAIAIGIFGLIMVFLALILR